MNKVFNVLNLILFGNKSCKIICNFLCLLADSSVLSPEENDNDDDTDMSPTNDGFIIISLYCASI